MWDLAGTLLLERRLASDARGICYSPKGDAIAVSCDDGAVRVLSPSLGVRQSFKTSGTPNGLAYSPDGARLAAALGDWKDAVAGSVELWDVANARRQKAFGLDGPAGAVAFDAGDAVLIAGRWSGAIEWYSLPDGERLAEGNAPKDVVASAAFSPNSRALQSLPFPPPKPPPAVELPTFPWIGPQQINSNSTTTIR
jgi:WD40 repeat protein